MINQETNQPSKTEPRFSYGYIVVAASFFISLAALGFYNSFGILFKPMIAEFGWTRALTSGAFSLASFIRGLLGIIMGGMTDRLGPRTVVTLCGFLTGIGFLLMSQINNAWQMYLLYALLIGTGMSGVYVPLLSTVAKWFTRRRSMMTGIVVAGLSIGTVVMPPLTSWLTSLYNWRITYVTLGSIVMVIVIVAAQFLGRQPTQTRQLPRSEKEDLKRELKAEVEGYSLREAMKTNQFWLTSGLVFSTGVWRLALFVHIAPHITDLGFSAASAAGVLAFIGGIGILGNLIGGGISDRLGSKPAYLVSFILTTVSLLWLLQTRELWMFYLFAIIFGLGSGSAGPIQSPLIAQTFGMRSHGLIFGATNFAYTIGAALGPFLTGYIFDLTGSYQVAFIFCTAISIFGLILAVVLKPIGKREVRV